MNKIWIIVIAVFAVLLLGVMGGCGAIVGSYNGAVSQENSIKAQYEQNQNNYSNYFSKLKEAAQVPAMYTEDLEKIYGKLMEGRKGSDQELFRFIQEASPNVDASLYKNLQALIEAGRDSFQTDQKTLIDKLQIYNVTLETFPGNFLYPMLGFPKINLAEYKIVTNEETAVAFKTKKAAPIKLREEKATTN